MTSKILLENIKIYAFHGVMPEEKIIGTYFLVNAELHADLGKASETDNLNDTVNYAEINEVIHQEMNVPSELLEHVAARIINKIQSAFSQVTFAKIKITKTNPPMKGEMAGVSVELEKTLR